MRPRPRKALALAAPLAFLVLLAQIGTATAAHADDASAASVTPPPPAASNAALDALFVALAKSPGLFARFREDKQIALLVAPLKSEGTVHFDRSKGLARHTLAPSKRSILLGNGTLTVWDGTKTEVIQLSSQPALRAFADSFSMFLAADRKGLERVFRLDLTGDPRDPQAKWRLRLTPLAPQLQKIVKELEVEGQGIALSTLRVSEASGDVSTTTFYDVDTSKKYSAAEAASVFRVPGPSS
jgi:hypothetical protein